MPETGTRGNRIGGDLVRYGGAIVLAAGMSAIQVFVIPHRLDVATYGQYRLFLLFVNYFGLLQLGIGDGAFLRWAGEASDAIAREWKHLSQRLLALQVALLVAVAIVAPFLEYETRLFAIAIAACALFVNWNALSGYALQAAGDFKGAGRAIAFAPTLFVLALVVLGPKSLVAILGLYCATFLLASLYGAMRVLEHHGEEATLDTALQVRSLIANGFPVLGASIAAGLAQSIDRLIVSAMVPITDFALYGFAGTASVAAASVTQALSRVALSHVARRPIQERAAFIGTFLYVIAAGYGASLIFEPPFERVVASHLPDYVAALPIVRAILVALPIWVAVHVVLVGTLQSYGLVRRQLVVELIGTAIVAAATVVALMMHATLWQVAAAAAGAALAAFIIGVLVVRHSVAEARTQPVIPFVAVIAWDGAALVAVQARDGGWLAHSLLVAAAVVLPTAWMLLRLKQRQVR